MSDTKHKLEVTASKSNPAAARHQDWAVVYYPANENEWRLLYTTDSLLSAQEFATECRENGIETGITESLADFVVLAYSQLDIIWKD